MDRVSDYRRPRPDLAQAWTRFNFLLLNILKRCPLEAVDGWKVCSLLKRWLSCESIENTNDQEASNRNSPTRSLDFSNWKLLKAPRESGSESGSWGDQTLVTRPNKEIFEPIAFLLALMRKISNWAPSLTEFAIRQNGLVHTFRGQKFDHRHLGSAFLTTLSPRNVNYFAETFKLFL